MTQTMDNPRIATLKARASLVGAAVNILQTAMKLTFGVWWNSAALVADGIHSLSDLLSDLLVIIAVRFGSRKADKDHPYGHRRFETVATIILGISLIGIGAGICWSIAHRMTHPEMLAIPDPQVMMIAAASIFINEALYHYTKYIAKATRSKLLLANAWHQRSDAFSSLVVLLGVAGVMLGYSYADGIAGVIVALMVAKIGWSLVHDSVKELVDTSLPPTLIGEIRKVILNIEGVEGIHLLRSRQSGEDAFIDAHIVVNPRITVSEGHAIGDAVRDELVAQFDDVMDVLVHIDPENDEGHHKAHRALTRNDITQQLKLVMEPSINVLDFRVHYTGAIMDLELIVPLSVSQSSQQLAQLQEACRALKKGISTLNDVTVFFKL